jgi:BirA family transcriptional regulator, biotin operon repressor / biotin---[acetyl-CoA-carboxylase] ligase
MNPDLSPQDLDTLKTLLNAKGQPVEPSGFVQPHLATPTELNCSLTSLTRHGCKLEQDMHAVRLIRSGLGVWKDYLQHVLPKQPHRSVEVYQTTASTQDPAKAQADKSVIILADQQTAGRGRLGRQWLAPKGTGLLFSMTHKFPPGQHDSIDRISFLTAVALSQAIQDITGHGPVQIRWPNDIYINHRKLAGILVEIIQPAAADHATAVIGIGINVSLTENQLAEMPPELRSRVTSFAMLGWRADRLLIAEKIITQIHRNLHTQDVSPLVDEWRARNLHREQTITVKSNNQTIAGTVIDLDPDLGLIIRRDTGEIVHLPAATTTLL